MYQLGFLSRLFLTVVVCCSEIKVLLKRVSQIKQSRMKKRRRRIDQTINETVHKMELMSKRSQEEAQRQWFVFVAKLMLGIFTTLYAFHFSDAFYRSRQEDFQKLCNDFQGTHHFALSEG